MAKGKKGKQKQDEGAARTFPATIPEETEAEIRSPKTQDNGGMMTLGTVSDNTQWGAAPPAPQSGHMNSPHGGAPGLSAATWGAPPPPAATAAAARATPQSTARQTLFGPASDDGSGWPADGGGGQGWTDDEEYDSQNDYSPPPAGTGKPGWQSWGEEASRISKVTPSPHAPPGLVGSKAQVSSQQRSQILNSLLSQPPQNNNYLKHAQPLYPGAQQQQQHHQTMPTSRGHANPYPGAGGGQNAYPGRPAAGPPGHSTAHARGQSQTTAIAENSLRQFNQKLAQLKQQQNKRSRHSSMPGDTWAHTQDNSAAGWGAWGNTGGNQYSSSDGEDEDEDDDWEDARKVRFASKGESMKDGGGGGGWGQDDWGGGGGWGDDKGAVGGWGNDDDGWGGGRQSKGGDSKGGNSWGGGWGGADTKSTGGWGADPPIPSGNAWGGGGGWGSATPQSMNHATLGGGWGAGADVKKDTIPRTKDTNYVMPSKTLTHAYKGTTIPLNYVDAHNKLNEYTNVKFTESNGEALSAVNNAFFGKERKARERIRWAFPPDKDPRVSSVLDWIEAVQYALGAFGLHKFLQTQERGALLVNAAYRPPKNPNEPAFDWMIFDQLQETQDKILQESVALYEPENQTIVFVFLPSPSGNSVAIWRRKINVPNNIKLMLQAQIHHAMAGLRHDKDYLVYVDEKPQPVMAHSGVPLSKSATTSPYTRTRKGSLPPIYTAPDGVLTMKKSRWGKAPKDPNKPKKRKWWHIRW